MPTTWMQLSAACVVASVLGCTRGAGTVPSLDAAVIARMVARAASAELALYPGEQKVLPAGVRLEAGPLLSKGVVFYRAWIPRDHWHPFQIAVIGSQAFPLGGFESPDLVSIARRLSPQGTSANALHEVAEQLALLADKNGGVEYAFLAKPGRSDLRAAWAHAAPSAWPRDTIVRLAAEGWHVGLTLFSQETRSFAQSWIPEAYSFSFDSIGQLEGWARRAGDPIVLTSLLPEPKSVGPPD